MEIQEEREAFEAWVKSKGRSVDRFTDGGYKSMTLDNEWEAWQAAKASVDTISNDIRIGTQVKITNPDDTFEYGVEPGDEGVVVWVGVFGTVFGVCIPKKDEVWSFGSHQFEVISNEVQVQVSVPEGFVLVEKDLIQSIHQSCNNALDINDMDIYKGLCMAIIDDAEAMIEAQEPSND